MSPALPSPPKFTVDDIERWLGRDTIFRARNHILIDVLDVRWDGSVFRAEVAPKDSARQPDFRLVIDVDSKGRMRSRCSCNERTGCVHVAAALLWFHEYNRDIEEPSSSGLRRDLAEWVDAAAKVHHTGQNRPATPRANYRILYVLSPDHYGSGHILRIHKGVNEKDGGFSSIGTLFEAVDTVFSKRPKFIDESDLRIIQILATSSITHFPKRIADGYRLEGGAGAELLEQIISTGRLVYLCQDEWKLMSKGEPRVAHFGWTVGADTMIRPVVETSPGSDEVIPVKPAWYVDYEIGCLGQAMLPMDEAVVDLYRAMPPVAAGELPALVQALRSISADLPTPTLQEDLDLPSVDCTPVPILRLNTLPRYVPGGTVPMDIASIEFDYGGHSFALGSPARVARHGIDGAVHVLRRRQEEYDYLEQLVGMGFKFVPAGMRIGPSPFPIQALHLSPSDWVAFMLSEEPAKLRANGWRVYIEPDFSYNIVDVEELQTTIRQTDKDWLEVEVGIDIDGTVVRIEPLLTELLEADSRWGKGKLCDIPDNELIVLAIPNGPRVRFPAARLKPIVETFIDLLTSGTPGPLLMSAYDSGRIEDKFGKERWQFDGDESIRKLIHRLSTEDGVSPAIAPAGLMAKLRDYQAYGVGWLQYLRANNLGGALCDDMGVGKTIQTLAHILIEKEEGRLDCPALIIVPTSLVHNWLREAKKFAPSLRTMALHGAERAAGYSEIPSHDLVVTTYPILWRDAEQITQHKFHLLVPDEAQTAKNIRSQAAQVLRRLDARHRISLTGTPLENNLGELFSHFDFLLPGFFGNEKSFNKQWRNPIEKENNTTRRELLARRIKPFMLRRKKTDVATELPPKTIMIQSVQFDTKQRDLYEVTRAFLKGKLQRLVEVKGFNQSQVEIFAALTKLRQICCDPMLLKLAPPAETPNSAKLELLMTLLPEMIEEGRKVLIFSSFTSMLEIISARLNGVGIQHATLTGDTPDRQAQVDSFQSGQVPVFLLSLKAGGVGLNLTAADTVIVFDPWWNPAAENQAIDRAYRIGQINPVFVYKLIAAGSIEEKILAMQEKKWQLTEGILSNDGAGGIKFSEEELASMLEPLS